MIDLGDLSAASDPELTSIRLDLLYKRVGLLENYIDATLHVPYALVDDWNRLIEANNRIVEEMRRREKEQKG